MKRHFTNIKILWITALHKRHNIRCQTAGFTLLELLVVLVILGLLAAYVGPRYFQQLGKAEVRSAQTQLNALSKALDTYRLDMGRYPNTQEGLQALTHAPGQTTPNSPQTPGADFYALYQSPNSRWAGPYLDKALPLDPWGHPYQYRSPGQQSDYELYTLGKDGAPGGDGENADIYHSLAAKHSSLSPAQQALPQAVAQGLGS